LHCRLIYENAETQAAATAFTGAVEGIGTPGEQPDSPLERGCDI
jgi:hypothetical protein